MFEPIRLANYVPPATPAEIPFFLRETPYGEDDDVAYLVGVHPEQVGD